jgi:hypothetical protein
MGRDFAEEPAGLFFQLIRASACWYLCWYRQQSPIKVTSNSDGYGTKRLPARGTTVKSIIITIA